MARATSGAQFTFSLLHAWIQYVAALGVTSATENSLCSLLGWLLRVLALLISGVLNSYQEKHFMG